MAKKSLVFATLLTIIITISGCFYLNITSPLDTDVDNTTLGEKTGTAECYSILWLVAWGDAGSAAAARNGDISVIKHMDRQTFSVLWGVYTKETTIVYGD